MMDMKEMGKLQKLKDSMVLEVSTVNNMDVDNKENKIDSKNERKENKINSINKTNYNDKNNQFENKQLTREIRRGQIWYVNLGNPIGSIQKGVRPCLVDSNNLNNRFSNIINIYPLTSQMTKASIPVHVEVEGYGLKEKSIILVEQGIPVDKRFQLLEYIGTVDELVMKKVNKAMNIQHGDLKPKTTFQRLSADKQEHIINKLNIIKECNTVLKFLTRINGSQKDIDIAEDEKFSAENSLMSFCYENGLNCDEFYTQANGINSSIAL